MSSRGGFLSMDDFASMTFDEMQHEVSRVQESSGLAPALPMLMQSLLEGPALGMASDPLRHPRRARPPVPRVEPASPTPDGNDYDELLALDDHVVRRGVSTRAMQRLFRRRAGARDRAKECHICMDNFQRGDALVELTCDHRFHDRCLREWFRENRTCPVCRDEVEA